MQRMETLRKIIIEPLLELKNQTNSSKDVRTITRCLYEFLIRNKIDEKLENKIKEKLEEGFNELATEYKTSFKVLLDVLDEIVLVFGDDKITFDKYMQVLKIGLR
ncbi:MAG TPA: hypothetical protein DCZ30_01610 [Clostridiales bacterium]|nr:hypothetical protein [Clostridiales bacterium]